MEEKIHNLIKERGPWFLKGSFLSKIGMNCKSKIIRIEVINNSNFKNLIKYIEIIKIKKTKTVIVHLDCENIKVTTDINKNIKFNLFLFK